MSTTTSDIAAGAVVRWISSNTYKQGVVEAVVPAGRTPADVGFPKAGGGGLARDHESYIVRGRKITNRGDEYGSKALYWPRVSLLELRTPADVVAPVSNGWQPIESMELWAVGVVTDGERAAVSQKAETDFGGHYFAVDPEDGLDWEPTHWMPLPSAPSQIEEGKDNG